MMMVTLEQEFVTRLRSKSSAVGKNATHRSRDMSPKSVTHEAHTHKTQCVRMNRPTTYLTCIITLLTFLFFQVGVGQISKVDVCYLQALSSSPAQ